MVVEQLELFPLSQDEKNAQRIEEVFQRSERVRKGLYAKHGEILKMLLEIKHDFEQMKQVICKGQ